MGSEDKEKHKFNPLTKAVAPILAAAFISLIGTGGGMILKHEGDVRNIRRHLERVNVDKYRRNLMHYRAHYSDARDCVVRNKRIARAAQEESELPSIATDMAEACEEDKAEWKELIENFVEENKHMGYD